MVQPIVCHVFNLLLVESKALSGLWGLRCPYALSLFSLMDSPIMEGSFVGKGLFTMDYTKC